MTRGAITTIYSSTENVVVANTTAERTIAGPGVGSLVMPAGFLEVGTSLRILIRGVFGTSTSNPTCRWRVKLGSTVILDTTALAVSSSSQTGRLFDAEAVVVCRATGKSGAVIGNGGVNYHGQPPGASDFTPQTAPTAVDTTQPLALDVTCQWSATNAANTIATTHFLIWAEQPI